MKTAIALRHFNAGTPSATLIASIVHPDGNEIELVTLMGNDINPHTACEEAVNVLNQLAMRFELLTHVNNPVSIWHQDAINAMEFEFGMEDMKAQLAEYVSNQNKQGE
jgi:hypothetical protein